MAFEPFLIAQAPGGGDIPAPDSGAAGELHLDEAEHGTFPPFDGHYFPSQLLWLAITFVALYLLMARIALPRIAGILEVRRDRIAGDLAEADRARRETDAAIAAFEQALAAARQKAGAIVRADRAALEAGLAARRSAEDAALAARLAAADARIAQIRDTAMADVGAIAAETAEAVVRRLIGLAAKAESAAAVTAAMKG